jgi:hypothetical protein
VRLEPNHHLPFSGLTLDQLAHLPQAAMFRLTPRGGAQYPSATRTLIEPRPFTTSASAKARAKP